MVAGTSERNPMIEDHLSVSVHDVAQYVIANETFYNNDGIGNMKLHKIVYLCQAFSMAWRGKPMFGEDVLAGISGPVINEFYEYHKGVFVVQSWPLGNKENLSAEDKVIIDHLLKSYAHCTGKTLSEITKSHVPWKRALQDSESELPVIDLMVMRNFYRALTDAPKNARAYAERFMDRYEDTEHL